MHRGLRHYRVSRYAPATYKSDSVKSFEVGAKNNFNNRVRLASSVYYIKWNKNPAGNVAPPSVRFSGPTISATPYPEGV